LNLAAGVHAQGHAYPLAGGDSGLQLHIGNGLPLPIQAAIPNVSFPTPAQLLVAEVPGAWVQQTAGPDPKQIRIVYPVLSRVAAYAKRGVGSFAGLDVYQVATNLSVVFPQPSGAWVLGLDARTGATTTTFATSLLGVPSTIRYSNALGQRFGGPARFFVGNPGTKPPGAHFAGVNATVWANAVQGFGAPPCKHPAFGGGDPFCVAALLQAVPQTGLGGPAAWGGAAGVTAATPGGTPAALATSPGATMAAKPNKGVEPGFMVVSANAAGSILQSAFTAPAPTAMTAPTNMASSTGYPWTTGMLTIAAPAAAGGGEFFMITGMDSRVSGVGVIQLVSGTLSRRAITGPNANRAWLRLNIPEPSATLQTLGALGTLALCHALARRRSRWREPRTGRRRASFARREWRQAGRPTRAAATSASPATGRADRRWPGRSRA
jgi:hypothetical protein